MKVLVTADIHINAYANHNLFHDPLFRLNQFDKLAQRFLNIADMFDVGALVIAGDFFHVAAPRPFIVNRAIEFLETLTKKMHVYLIHGNHDIDGRGIVTRDSTLLSICHRLPRVHYCHKEFYTLDGTRFYFLGWVPNLENEIEELQKQGGTDVFIGHFQPGTVMIGQYGQFLHGGQSIPDVPPWKIGFVGDIHTHQVCKGNIVVPGVALQHNFGDPPSPGIICFDTQTMTWEHIPTIVPGTWNFLQLVITDDLVSSDAWKIVRPGTQTQSTRMQKTFDKKLDILAVIQEQIEAHHLENIHKTILEKIPKDIRYDNDLYFILEKLTIHNFRSIEHFEWENIGEGVKLLFGNNGAGKSALIDALFFALSGTGSARTLTRKGCINMYVEITLFYAGFTHTIRRGWAKNGTLVYKINNIEQQAENQRELTKRIEERLSFLQFTDLMYHHQDRPGFLSSYNYAARVDLISRVLGLCLVQSLYSEAQRQLLDYDYRLHAIRDKLVHVNALADQDMLVDLINTEEKDDDGKEIHLKNLQHDLRTLLQTERRKYEKSIARKAVLYDHIERSTSNVAAITAQKSALTQRICFTCRQPIDNEKYAALSEEVSTEISERDTNLRVWRQELDDLNSISPDMIEKLENRLEQMTSRICALEFAREHREKMFQIKTEVENAKEERRVLQDQYRKLITEQEPLHAYVELFTPSGPVMRTILLTLSEIFSTDVIRVRAHKHLVNGDIRPDFTIDIKVGDAWIGYDIASGGERTLADMVILQKIIHLSGGIGLLVLDETLKFLDLENIERTIDVIKNMQVSNIIIISHTENFPYYDTSIYTARNMEGITEYVIR